MYIQSIHLSGVLNPWLITTGLVKVTSLATCIGQLHMPLANSQLQYQLFTMPTAMLPILTLQIKYGCALTCYHINFYHFNNSTLQWLSTRYVFQNTHINSLQDNKYYNLIRGL